MSLYQWHEDGSYRPVPPPEKCFACDKRPTMILSYLDSMGRLEDWVGCRTHVGKKKAALKEGTAYRLSEVTEKTYRPIEAEVVQSVK